jgi:hypothetical protein
MVRDDAGSLHLPMAAVLLLFTVSGFETWGFLRHWRQLMERQLQLDRCVARTAIELRDILQSIETANRKIHFLRRELAIGALIPQTRAVHQATLRTLVAWQDARMLQWRIIQGKWLAGLACEKRGGIRVPLRNLPWVRDPPDLIGPRPLRWLAGAEMEFFVQSSHSPRHSAARILYENDRWSAVWTSPI